MLKIKNWWNRVTDKNTYMLYVCKPMNYDLLTEIINDIQKCKYGRIGTTVFDDKILFLFDDKVELAYFRMRWGGEINILGIEK